MFIFFEKDMRGGVSYTTYISYIYIYIYIYIYSKASNRYLKSYDPKQESKHIIYFNANNLCGYAMPKFIPTSGFKWIYPEEFELNKKIGNSWKGCVLEVHLGYPKDLRELHKDYSIAPDK